MKNCTRAFFKEIFFSELFWYTFGEDRFFKPKFRLFGHIDISAKILKDFSKNHYFEKNEVRAKTIQKKPYDDGWPARGHIGAYQNE